MNFKPFFVHYNRKLHEHKSSRGYAGFTAHVSPDEGRNIRVRISFCSRKDVFCKREGRDSALAKEYNVCNARELGKVLGKAEDMARGTSYWEDYPGRYDYLYKYMM